MKWLNNHILQGMIWKDCKGQDLLEYALAIGMMALAAVAVMPPLSATVSNVFTRIESIMTANVP